MVEITPKTKHYLRKDLAVRIKWRTFTPDLVGVPCSGAEIIPFEPDPVRTGVGKLQYRQSYPHYI